VTYPPSGQPSVSDPGAWGADDQVHPQQRSFTTEPPAGAQQTYLRQPYPADPYGQGYQGYQAPAQHGAMPHYAAQPAAYSQPGYQHGYGQPPAYVPLPGAPPPASGRRGVGGMVALVAGSVVLLLLLVGVGVALLLRSGDESPTAASPAGRASATGPAEYPASIAFPQTIAGMTRIEDEDLDRLSNLIVDGLKASDYIETALAAYYSSASEPTKIVGLIGATGKITNPATELSKMLSGTSVTGTVTVDPGPLGGQMKCGIRDDSAQRLTVCGWADGGSLGLGIFLDRTMSDGETLFRQIRGEVLKRG
jgi:hypothetical protein